MKLSLLLTLILCGISFLSLSGCTYKEVGMCTYLGTCKGGGDDADCGDDCEAPAPAAVKAKSGGDSGTTEGSGE